MVENLLATMYEMYLQSKIVARIGNITPYIIYTTNLLEKMKLSTPESFNNLEKSKESNPKIMNMAK